MPRSGPDWGSDPVRTGPDLGSGPVRGPVRPFALGSGSGFGMGWISCEPGSNPTAPRTSLTLAHTSMNLLMQTIQYIFVTMF